MITLKINWKRQDDEGFTIGIDSDMMVKSEVLGVQVKAKRAFIWVEEMPTWTEKSVELADLKADPQLAAAFRLK